MLANLAPIMNMTQIEPLPVSFLGSEEIAYCITYLLQIIEE